MQQVTFSAGWQGCSRNSDSVFLSGKKNELKMVLCQGVQMLAVMEMELFLQCSKDKHIILIPFTETFACPLWIRNCLRPGHLFLYNWISVKCSIKAKKTKVPHSNNPYSNCSENSILLNSNTFHGAVRDR